MIITCSSIFLKCNIREYAGKKCLGTNHCSSLNNAFLCNDYIFIVRHCLYFYCKIFSTLRFKQLAGDKRELIPRGNEQSMLTEQLLKPSTLNWFTSFRNIVLIGWSIKQLLQKEQQSCKAPLMELSEKSKTFPLTVFQSIFSGFCLSQTEVVLKWLKNVRQFGHNAIFSHTKMSQNEKMTENF